MQISAATPAAPVAGAVSIACASLLASNFGEELGEKTTKFVSNTIGLAKNEGFHIFGDGKQRVVQNRDTRHYRNSVHMLPLRDREYYAILGIITWYALGGRLRMVLPSDLRFPGAFARRTGSLPATLEYIQGTAKKKLQDLGKKYGCHTCGIQNPIKFYGDHMPPLSNVLKNRKNFLENVFNLAITQRFFPQCGTCSNQQGPAVFMNRRKLIKHSCGGPKLLQCGALLSLTQTVENSQIGKKFRETVDNGFRTLGGAASIPRNWRKNSGALGTARKWFSVREKAVRRALNSDAPWGARWRLSEEVSDIRHKKSSL
ncbi:hypothetical protein AAMO2058_000748300 [Amorphochlora amoebiformis]